MASNRLMKVTGHLASELSEKDTLAMDWTTAKIPTFDELPPFKNFPGCAWGVWGAEDQLGTVNLLTDALVKKTASEEIQLRFLVPKGFLLTYTHDLKDREDRFSELVSLIASLLRIPSLKDATSIRPLNFPAKVRAALSRYPFFAIAEVWNDSRCLVASLQKLI